MDELKDITAAAGHLARARNSYIASGDHEETKKVTMEARLIRLMEDGMAKASDMVNKEEELKLEDYAAIESFHAMRSGVKSLLQTNENEPESSNGKVEEMPEPEMVVG